MRAKINIRYALNESYSVSNKNYSISQRFPQILCLGALKE